MIRIKKFDGTFEPHDPQKYHDKVFLAIDGLKVSASEIEMRAGLMIQDGTTSREIQLSLIKSCADMISREEPDYEIAAARMLNQLIRKEVYRQYSPLPFIEMIKKNINIGAYDGKYLFDHYTEEELIEFGKHIDYNKDDKFVYSGLKTMHDKYLIKRYKKLIETPQEVNMLVNLFAFAKYEASERKKWVIEGYNILSDFEASLPTPTMTKLRTQFKKFISCNLIHPGDDKETLANASRAIMFLVAAGAGLGLMPGNIRGLGADIGNGSITHTGALPLVRSYERATKAFMQPTRHGSTTNYYPFFHKEILSIMKWGNNKGTTSTRVREMDHSVMFNELFFERYLKGEDVTLFYMNDVKDLISYMGYDEFKEKYEYYENTVPKSNQTRVPAKLIFDEFIDERFLQSREYCSFNENIQKQGTYNIPIIMSNLCTEITQPVMPLRDISIKRNIRFLSDSHKELYYEMRNKAYYHMDDYEEQKKYLYKMTKCFEFCSDDMTRKVNDKKPFDYFTLSGLPNLSEIGVCILGGINLGYVSDKRLPIVSEYLVRFQEELIDYMDYDLPEVEKAATMRRGIGLGFSDVFHALAKNKLFYNTREARQFLHDRVEICAYNMIKTSIQLAKERGPCMLYTDTKFSEGLLPCDTYNKNVDELVGPNELVTLDWELLRSDLKKYGIRHSTLMANAPFGTSASVSNSTSGVEPPRDLCNLKQNDYKLVPDIKKYGKYYTTSWDLDFNNKDYFKFLACAQKWMCQTISVNQYLNLLREPDNKIKRSDLVEDVLIARYYGLKTLYYSNILSNESKDGIDEEDESVEDREEDNNDAMLGGCSSGGCYV